MTVDGATTSYTYNDLDQLLTAGGTTFAYDARGNLIRSTASADVTTYGWDALDRLSEVILPDGTPLGYTYDVDGRRVRQVVGGAETNYLWDEASAYGDVVLESDGTGAAQASYVLGGTELLSQTRGGVTSYYLHDGLGNVRGLSNAAGALTDAYEYTAFGELIGRQGTADNAYLFTGQQFDETTGLYSLRARFYDPALGRFLSRDTAGGISGTNGYAYVLDNPVNATDPTGHDDLFEYSQANEQSEEEAPAVEEYGNIAADANAVPNAGLQRIEADSLYQRYLANNARVMDALPSTLEKPPVSLARAVYQGWDGPEFVVGSSNTYNDPLGIVLEDELFKLGSDVVEQGGEFVGGIYQEGATPLTVRHVEVNMLDYFLRIADSLPHDTRVAIGVANEICEACLEILGGIGRNLGDAYVVEISNGVRLIFYGF